MCKKNQYKRSSTRFNVEFSIHVRNILVARVASRGHMTSTGSRTTRAARDSGFDVTSCRALRPSAGPKSMNRRNPGNDNNFNIRTIKFRCLPSDGDEPSDCIHLVACSKRRGNEFLPVNTCTSCCWPRRFYLSATRDVLVPNNTP